MTRGEILKSPWFRRGIILLVAIPACYAAYLLGIALGPTKATTTEKMALLTCGLEVDPAQLELGEVWEDPHFVQSVTITNRGDKEQRITDMVGGCECTSIEPRAFNLSPGQSQDVNVKIDLTHRFPHQFGMDTRELGVTVHPMLADRGAASDGWKVTGVIKSRVSLDARGLEFADMCSQGGPLATRKMRATAHVPLAALEAFAPQDKATVRVIPVANQPGKYDIAVTPNPELPIGEFRFEITLVAVESNNVKSPVASFQVSGEIVSPVRIVPNLILLGEHPVGSKAEAFVTIRFPTAGWSVERVEPERSETVVVREEPHDGHLCYRISQTLSKASDQKQVVRFVCRRPSNQVETLSVSVVYLGLARQEAKK